MADTHTHLLKSSCHWLAVDKFKLVLERVAATRGIVLGENLTDGGYPTLFRALHSRGEPLIGGS